MRDSEGGRRCFGVEGGLGARDGSRRCKLHL